MQKQLQKLKFDPTNEIRAHQGRQNTASLLEGTHEATIENQKVILNQIIAKSLITISDNQVHTFI